MVKDQVYDLDGPYLHLNLWRCLNCGEIVDPAILTVRKQKDTQPEQWDTERDGPVRKATIKSRKESRVIG